MTDIYKAAQQALEALEDHAKQYPHMQKGYTVDAIAALRTALAEHPEQELVRGEWQGYTWNPYAISQPKAEPLTDEEIYECERIAAIRHHRHKNSIRGQQMTPADDLQWHFARAIIAAAPRITPARQAGVADESGRVEAGLQPPLDQQPVIA